MRRCQHRHMCRCSGAHMCAPVPCYGMGRLEGKRWTRRAPATGPAAKGSVRRPEGGLAESILMPCTAPRAGHRGSQRHMETVGSDGAITRRSLIALAGAGAGSVVRPRGALAQLLTARSSALAGLPLVTSGLQAGPGQPPIVARNAWAQGVEHPKVAPEYGSVKLAFVHHTENPDGYSAAEVPAMLRSIYVFHRYTHGWNDIGYNFAIDRFGRIFEARAGGIDEPVVGAQAGGYNVYSTGIAILGTYSAQRISAAALGALEHLIAWKLSLHGAPVEGHVNVRVTPGGAVYSRYPANAPVSLPRVAGHRDADSTDCPGDALYGELAGVRQGAAALVGEPARLTLGLTAATVPGGQSALSGSMRLLDGTP